MTLLQGFPTQPTKVVGLGKAYQWNYNNNVPEPLPEPPFFVRPLHALAPKGTALQVPAGTEATYEVELAIVIGKGGKNIKLKDAINHVAGYALILDMSATKYHRETGSGEDRTLPLCKGFDTFNPIGRFIDRSEVPDSRALTLALEINGKQVSHDQTSNLIYTVEQEIAFASGITTINAGDILLTGAAKGVSSIGPGNKMRATLITRDGKELDSFEIDVIARPDGFDGTRHWTEWIQ